MSSNIQTARKEAYAIVKRFIETNYPGTLVLLHKNGFGKTTIQVLTFKDYDDACILAQGHEHIEKVILPKLEDAGLIEERDFVYYRAMEMICSTYLGMVAGAEEDVLEKNRMLHDLFMPMAKRHELVIKCHDPECPFILQEWAISKDNPDRIRKVVATVKMFVRKELQYNAQVIILDELDGTMDPQPQGCSEELYKKLQKTVGEQMITTDNELNLLILNIFGRKINDRDHILEEIKEKRKELQDQVLANDYNNFDQDEVDEMNQIWQIATDGFLMTDGSGKPEDWYFKGNIHRVPLLYEIADALTDQKRYITKKIIASMARMRKNPILKRKIQNLFRMLLNRTSEPGIETVPYKYHKAKWMIPTFQGEDCPYPDDRWKIYILRSLQFLLILRISIKCSLKAGWNWKPLKNS